MSTHVNLLVDVCSPMGRETVLVPAQWEEGKPNVQASLSFWGMGANLATTMSRPIPNIQWRETRTSACRYARSLAAFQTRTPVTPLATAGAKLNILAPARRIFANTCWTLAAYRVHIVTSTPSTHILQISGFLPLLPRSIPLHHLWRRPNPLLLHPFEHPQLPSHPPLRPKPHRQPRPRHRLIHCAPSRRTGVLRAGHSGVRAAGSRR